jgi:hypothetical protein
MEHNVTMLDVNERTKMVMLHRVAGKTPSGLCHRLVTLAGRCPSFSQVRNRSPTHHVTDRPAPSAVRPHPSGMSKIYVPPSLHFLYYIFQDIQSLLGHLASASHSWCPNSGPIDYTKVSM